jgi:hypothetical protein
MAREAPEVLARMQEADRNSLKRWGHGNAMAQIYHHVIMPLASGLDKKIEVQWAMDDFEARFGRKAEGMWLSECAVDIPTLEALADAGISFVTLSPYQAKSVADDGKNFRAVDIGNLDISQPYKVELPSGREIAVFFYHGSLAQSIAFDGLLQNGDRFWERLVQCAYSCSSENGILSMATDGETYGHHVKFGEMALAHVLSQGIAGRDGVELTNFGAYLEEHPPRGIVILHEPSSWSCAHGVERWKSNCGCTTGGHDGWNQEWRAPLRAFMNEVKAGIDRHFFSAGGAVFKDAEKALLAFGQVLCNPETAKDFEAEHFIKKQDNTAWGLLRMQENALAAFASCAWFFDDISRIEPVKALSFALRAMDLAVLTQGRDLLPAVLKILGAAISNKPEEGDGARVFKNRVLPTRQDMASLCLFTYLYAYCDGLLPAGGQAKNSDVKSPDEVSMVFPALKVLLRDIEHVGAASDIIRGKALVGHSETSEGAMITWSGSLPAMDLENEVFFGNAELEAHGAEGKIYSHKSSDLARHLHDFLDIRMLTRTIRTAKAERILALQHCISNLARPEEGQVTQHYDAFWTELLPYLPVACFRSPALTEENLEQAALIMHKANFSDALKQRCAQMLDDDVLTLVQERRVPDVQLHAAVERARRILPDINLWKVQNYLWSDAAVLHEYSKTAQVVGLDYLSRVSSS